MENSDLDNDNMLSRDEVFAHEEMITHFVDTSKSAPTIAD
jgi:hypothetical protein